MSASLEHITASTPMGANLVEGGATFRVWAPSANHVYVARDGAKDYDPKPEDELTKDPATGCWSGFFSGVEDGSKYRYYVVGSPGYRGRNGHGVGVSGEGLKRDPWARELEFGWPDVTAVDFPDVDCIVRDADYLWHDQAFVPPACNDLIVYQLHVGVFYARDDQGRDLRPNRVSKLLDAVDRLEYLADLGVTAVQPLPLVEFSGEWSVGYNGVDLFSPEMDYCVNAADLPRYVDKVNALLARKGQAPLAREQLIGQVNQCKAFVDLCHLCGLAVITDVVYNHAGGDLDPQSLDYFDFPPNPNCDNSLFFTREEWAGGKVFAYWKREVRAFLIENARMFLVDYHMDGIRFDEVSTIDNKGGWAFCQELTAALRAVKPQAVLIAEYWKDSRWLAVWPPPAGMGFHLGYNDLLRDAVRDILRQSSWGASASLGLGRLRAGLERPWNFSQAWQAYNCIENHDLVLDMDGDHRKPRIPALADPNDRRSWYARSRSRVALGLLLTAPGTPMLFMGQEFLEDKLWCDSPKKTDAFLWWAGLDGLDRHMSDFHRFARDLVWLRRTQAALRAEPVNVYHINEHDRILAFHRWVPGVGADVVVVVSLREEPFRDRSYSLGFPQAVRWTEIFNSDVYDEFSNPNAVGNAGSVRADGPAQHGLPASAGITIPANGFLVFAR